MRITIKKIAELANVSITTVSKVINGKDHDLNNSTIERVRAIIKEQNYKPSLLAQSMRYRQMKLIALMIPDIRNPFFIEIIRGAEDCVNKYGYSLVLCNTDNELNKEYEYIESLKARHIDGMLLSGVQIESRIQENKLLINVPFKFIKNRQESKLKNYLDQYGFLEITQYLIGLKHKNILCITGPTIYTHSQRTIQSYKEGLSANNIPLDNNNIFILSAYSAEAAYTECFDFLKNTKASAVICGNDLIAYGVLKVLRELHIAVPRQMSVVGYDDIASNLYLETPLTSYSPNCYALGWDNAISLIESIENRVLDDYIKNINAHLAIRGTTGEFYENTD